MNTALFIAGWWLVGFVSGATYDRLIEWHWARRDGHRMGPMTRGRLAFAVILGFGGPFATCGAIINILAWAMCRALEALLEWEEPVFPQKTKESRQP